MVQSDLARPVSAHKTSDSSDTQNSVSLCPLSSRRRVTEGDIWGHRLWPVLSPDAHWSLVESDRDLIEAELKQSAEIRGGEG